MHHHVLTGLVLSRVGDDSDCSSYEVDEDPIDINAAFVTCGRKPPPSNGAIGATARKHEDVIPNSELF